MKKGPPKTLGLGFDPTALEPESGFKPITEGQGSSIPTLAFSVLDGAERPPVSPGLYQSDLVLLQKHYQGLHRSGIKGVEESDPLPTFNHKEASAPSADFHSFATSGHIDDEDDDYQYDVGFVETDRIDVQSSPAPSSIMDPSAVVYSQQAAPYGEQFPSYLPKTIETRVGSADYDKKTIVSGDSVVYGKFSQGALPVEESSDYYEDHFYYDYYEDDELKSRLGMIAASSSASDAYAAADHQNEKPMSFFQLLNNLNGSSS